MKRIDDKELKQIQFSLLREFKNVCNHLHINYSLIGGTLLGAIRHKGFIPWDDDIDVCMPRDDFEVFVDFCLNNKTPFELYCNRLNKNYCYMFAKISDPSTKIIEHVSNRFSTDIGVHIDVFVYDAMGDTLTSAVKKYNSSRFYRELLVAANWKKYSRSKTHSFIYEPIRLIFFILSRFVNCSKLISKIEKKYVFNSFYSTNYVGNLCSDKRAKSIIERKYFENYVEIEFEGEMFKVFSGYELYLKSMYGDYMTLPPENKRISHHSFDAFRK